jgi:dTDP-4-dehydrorhamnose reductase
MMPLRYLLIGASGFVGTRLYAFLGRDKAVATYNKHPLEGGVAFNATRARLADSVLKRDSGLTHAFILYGVTNIDACARDPAGTERINVTSIKNIINELRDYGVIPVFVSSDAVFDGTRGLWTEQDIVSPVLTYGRHKLAIEEFLMRGSSPYLIVRLPKVVTAEPSGGDMFADWMGRLEQGAEIRCADDQIFSPIDVNNAIDAMISLAESGQTGLFHACSPKPVSRLELLQILAGEIRKFRKIDPRIVPCSIRDFDFAEPRPLDTSMSPAKLYATLGRGFDDVSLVCREAAAKRYGTPGRV